MPQTARAHGSVHLCNTARKATSQTPTDVAGVSLLCSQTSLGHGPHNTTTNSYLPSMVIRPEPCDRRVSICDSMSLVSDALDMWWAAHLGTLRTQGLWSQEELIYKCQGTQSHPSGLRSVPSSTVGQSSAGIGGQHSIDVLCQQARWSTVISSLPRSPSPVGLLYPTCYPSRSLASLGGPEHFSRSPQKVLLLTPRVVPPPGCHWDVFQKWGTPQVDLFATKQNKKCNGLCSLPSLNRGSLSHAFLLSWVGNLIYAFPPMPLINKVLLKIKRDRALSHHDSPGMASPVLVWHARGRFQTTRTCSRRTTDHCCTRTLPPCT
ncbi:uncharacterized protein RBU57_006714 [Macrochelys suwanniensis]